MPDELIERLQQARRFNQGFETVEYTACALVDMALHAPTRDRRRSTSPLSSATSLSASACRARSCMRHRLPHFQHLFSGSGYAAGYYVYMWAEVLDADGYDAFVEAGNPFDPAVAERLRRYRLLGGQHA